MKTAPRVRPIAALLLSAPFAALAATPFSLASYPLFLAPGIKPNVMIILDNSESMDGTMAGKVINGDDPTTRGNIARGILRGLLSSYRDSFNFGITSFQTGGASLYNTHAYYLGDATTMVYTNDCVGGISASNASLRCIANPQPANGYGYITYARSGDDADINDVLYSGAGDAQLYGIGVGGTNYHVYNYNDGTQPGGWGNFSGDYGVWGFTPTDAGFLPTTETTPRQIWIRRGWGYGDYPTGAGAINETVQVDSTTHFANLVRLLGNETSGGTGEIKNNAFFTPIAGTLSTVRDYFRGNSTPITQTCQKNFVMLATDGNPTGMANGQQYDPSQWVNTYNPVAGTWTFGQAQRDVFTQLTALRSIGVSGHTFDVQTYVVGMGDTLANASSVAALNQMAALGGGYPTAFVGSSSDSLQRAFQSIVSDIQAKTSAASSVALNTGSWTTGSAIYQAKFSSGDWSGTLLDFPVSASGAIATTPVWDAGVQVRAQNWNGGRNIITYKPSAAAGARGIPFRWPAAPATPTAAELDPSQTAALNLTPGGGSDTFGELRLRFLRGDASQEARSCASPPCAAPQFRNRSTSPLGDIVNSSPYYVAAPNFGYYDDFESAPYSSFASTWRLRTPVIYVGANDGMLHAINANTGAEMFGYVPSAVYGDLSKLTDLAYTHRYLVDGSPTVGDVFYNSAWHTLLVAGMRAGAKGLFALEVTDPSRFSEANAASIVRWEFQDPDMGYVFGQPLLVKTNNGRWSVVVSGGYNVGNANGHSMLFIIDAETGALVRKIDTGSGTAASPGGLSAPAAVDSNGDGVADLVYAGDLDGNLWKFDISSSTPASWSLGNGAVPLFATGSGHAITDRPDVTKFTAGGFLIAFGTGRYIASADNTDLTTQRIYAVRDTGTAATITLSLLVQQTITGTGTGLDGQQYRFSTHAVGPSQDYSTTGDNTIVLSTYLSDKRGWYLDLPDSGERVVSDARFRGGRAIFTSITPDVSSPCAYGGSGWVIELDAMTGNRFDSTTFDTNGDNALTNSDYISRTGIPSQAQNTSGRRIAAIPAAPGFMSNRAGGVTGLEDKFINTSDGTVVRVRETSGAGREGRVMWHEVR
ncbi:MAG TPA: PilC/PilY family type IV pilus protein [Caldimonas sp.]|nr:PilC/PilY family type IV pilus protein [Caldimonas sp.]HEX4235273.1 PilC/PilY family type IV pilus protein [Caldimonas sp.]